MAHTKVNGKFINLGRFEKRADALAARKAFITSLETGFPPEDSEFSCV